MPATANVVPSRATGLRRAAVTASLALLGLACAVVTASLPAPFSEPLTVIMGIAVAAGFAHVAWTRSKALPEPRWFRYAGPAVLAGFGGGQWHFLTSPVWDLVVLFGLIGLYILLYGSKQPSAAPLRRLFVSFLVPLVPLVWLGWSYWTLLDRSATDDERIEIQELRSRTKPALLDAQIELSKRLDALVNQIEESPGSPGARLSALSRDPSVRVAFVPPRARHTLPSIAFLGRPVGLAGLPPGVAPELFQALDRIETWDRHAPLLPGQFTAYWCGLGPDGGTFDTLVVRARDGISYGLLLNPGWIRRDLVQPALSAAGLSREVEVADAGTLTRGQRVLISDDQMPAALKFAQTNLTSYAIDRSRRQARKDRLSAELWFATLMFWILAAFWQLYRTARADVALAEMRANFVSAVSHELKTPLGMIRMYAEMLQLGLVGEGKKQEDYLGIIVDESDRLARLIDNVLDFSKIQKGTKTYHFETIDLREVVATALRQMEPAFEASGVSADFEPPASPVSVQADRDAAYQALLNLVSNAVKYGGDGFSVQLRTEGASALLAVADRGPGIPASEHKKVFAPFYRMGKEEERTSQGTGLGLALVAEIMKAHGGEARLTSAPGKGSTFTLVFPLASRGGLES